MPRHAQPITLSPTDQTELKSWVAAQRDGNYIANFFHFQPALNYGFAQPDPKQPWEQPVDAPGPLAVSAAGHHEQKFPILIEEGQLALSTVHLSLKGKLKGE